MPNGSSGFKREFKRIAHRGASGEAPENTIPAIQRAVEKYRIDMVEVDLCLTKEGIPVLHHDPTLARTTNGKGPVSEQPLAELKRLDAGFHFDPEGKGAFPYRGKGVAIPTLEEVLTQFPETAFCLEIKEKRTESVERILAVTQKIRRKGALLIGSSFGKVARALRQRAAGPVETFLSQDDLIWAYSLFRLGMKNFSPPAFYASIPIVWRAIRLDETDWVDFLHRSGVKVFYWTANDPSEMKQLIERGADGIVTDYPDRLNQIISF